MDPVHTPAAAFDLGLYYLTGQHVLHLRIFTDAIFKSVELVVNDVLCA